MHSAKRNISIVLALSLVLACFPVSFERCIIEPNNPSLDNASLKAYADLTVTQDAETYVEAAAEKSGMLPGDFVTTIGGIATVATGTQLSNDSLKFGQSLQDSLSNLIDAADYPAYSTLTAEQQSNWGSETNYNAAKFNSLMSAFGLGSSVDGWYESGGGNFEWTQDATDRLNQIGQIGQNWVAGVGNTVSSVMSTLDSSNYQTVIQNYTGIADSTFTEVNITDENWPSSLPRNFKIGKSNQVYINVNNRNYYYYTASTEVYWIITAWTGEQGGFYLTGFSENGFSYGSTTGGSNLQPPNQLTSTAETQEYSGNTYYAFEVGTQHFYVTSINSAPPYTQVSNKTTGINLCRKNGYVLFDYNPVIEDGKIEGYPEDISDAQNGNIIVYIPLGGLTPDTTWGDMTTPVSNDDDVDLDGIIELLQQFKFYVTGQLKVHDEGVYEAIGDVYGILDDIKNILPTLSNNDVPDAPDIIGDFDFPEFDQKATDLVDTISSLAPFGALLLISEMTAVLSASGHIDSPELEFTFDFFPDHSYTVTIDLSWLDDAKPIINVVCIIMLVYSLAGATIRLIELEAAS